MNPLLHLFNHRYRIQSRRWDGRKGSEGSCL